MNDELDADLDSVIITSKTKLDVDEVAHDEKGRQSLRSGRSNITGFESSMKMGDSKRDNIGN